MTASGKLPRGRHGLPREQVVRSQRQRLLAAMVEMAASKGYETISVADVLGAAGVGRETFYELFEDKQDCFLAAHQDLFDDFLERITAAYQGPELWPERVGNGVAELLGWLAADPDATRVLIIEIGKAGAATHGLFISNFSKISVMLNDGAEESQAAAALPNAANIAAGAIFARIYEEVLLDRSAELLRLLPEFTYEVLLPFLGEEEARKEAERLRAQP